MKKIVEFDKVYIEYPDSLIHEEDEKDIILESKTAKLSLEELKKGLEETQALHL